MSNNNNSLKYKLERWQNLFIKEVYERLSKHLDGLEIISYPYSIVMYLEDDKHLDNYAWWFYFSLVNDILVFKYRPKPDKKYIPDTIYIRDYYHVQEIVDLCLRTVEARYNRPTRVVEESPIEKPLKQSRTSHDDIIVPDRYEGELFTKNRDDSFLKKK